MKVCERCGKDNIDLLEVVVVAGKRHLLCNKCAARYKQELAAFNMEFSGIPKIEKGMSMILEGLHDAFGLDLSDQNFKDTPRRVGRAYAEIFRGLRDTDSQVEKLLGTSFQADMKEMIVARRVKAFSMCPHHFLPVEYTITVAYISNGSVLGISKLARLAVVLAKRPVLQEAFTEDLAEKLYTGVNAQGVGVWVEGTHYCMKMRGAGQVQSKTVTSAIRGCFEAPEVRSEFLALAKDGSQE
jgi:GTP cyclohydrolase I